MRSRVVWEIDGPGKSRMGRQMREPRLRKVMRGRGGVREPMVSGAAGVRPGSVRGVEWGG
jgi:hypothetical protein